MQNDLIKQIILKFKTEGSDQVKKVAESMSKSFNARDTERFMRNLEQVQQKFGKAGTGMSTELKKVTEYFKELNNQHFQKAERNLDRMGRLIKSQLENIERLKKEGASAEEIGRRQQTLNKATDRFESLANETPYTRPNTVRGFLNQAGGGGRFGTVGGVANIAGGVLSAISTAANQLRQGQLERQQNRIEVANVVKQSALDVFSGNMTRAQLYSDPARRKYIQDQTRQTDRMGNISAGAGAAAGAAGLIGGGIGLGSVLMGGAAITAGALALPALAVGAGAYGLYRGYQHYYGGGKERQHQQNLQSAERAAESQTMDLEYYKEFSKNADMRYNYQRQLQLGDATALDVRARFRNAGVLDEGQMAQSMLGFRRFGAQTAPFIAAQTAEMAKTMGMDQGTAQQMMQQVAGVNRGGIGNAKKDLEEIFRRAVSAGVNDSGLIEEYQKVASSMMQQLGSRMSAGDIANSMNSFLLEGAGQREIGAVSGAMNQFGQNLKGGSNLMQAKSTAGLLNMARGEDGQVNMLAYQYLAGMTPQELATLNENDPVLQQMGITPAKIQDFKKNQVMGTLRSNLGAGPGLKLLEKAKAGNTNLSEGEQRMLAQGFGMSGVAGQDIRTVQSFLKANLETAGAAGEGLTFAGPDGAQIGLKGVQTMTAEEVQAGIAGTNISAGTAVKAKAEGQTELDRQVYEKVSKNIDDVYKIFKEQSSQVMKDLDKNVLAGPIKEIGDAADRIATALSSAADRIEGNSSHSRSSARQPGD